MRVLLAGVVAVLLVPAGASAKPCPDAKLVPTKANVAKVRRAALCEVNRERETAGLVKLHPQKQLVNAAAAHTSDMVTRSYFSHDGPSGDTLVTRATNAGYVTDTLHFWRIGENIAFGSGPMGTAGEIVDMWMHSPPHREAILNSVYRDAGLGIAPGTPEGDAGATFTIDFGRRKK